MPDEAADRGVGMARVAAAGVLLPLPLLPLPLPLPLVLSPTTRWIRRSTVVTALVLSFTAPPLTVWMLVRCFRVVGDCRRRSVREGWVVLEFELELEAAALLVLVVEEDADEDDAGVECAIYMFDALDIALVSRVVVPEMAWLQNSRTFFVSERKRKRKKRDAPDEDGAFQHPVAIFGWDRAHDDLDVP